MNVLKIVHACMLSHFGCVRLIEILWTVARQAPLSMGFSRKEYWSGLPFPSPGDLPDQGSNSHLLPWQPDSLPLSHLRLRIVLSSEPYC